MPQADTNPNTQAAFQVKIEKLVYGGAGLARVDGQVLLVPYVLPGEVVRVEAGRRRAGVVEGRVVEVVESSEHRVTPPCSVFGRCGGCHYQHAAYPFQVAQKVEVLREVFQRVGKLEAPRDIEVVAGEPYGYRNRVQFHVREGKVGLLEAGSSHLCPLANCPIASPAVNRALDAVRRMARDRRFPPGIETVEVFTNESEILLDASPGTEVTNQEFYLWCDRWIAGSGNRWLDYPVGPFRFRVSRGSFFQVNRHLIEKLMSTVTEGLAGEAALDLYAGVGLFSLSLARCFRKVTAVESGTRAAADLRFNAERAGAAVETVQQKAEEYLASVDPPPEVIVADPPRAGLGRAVVDQLIRLKAPTLVLVSCDPATLARDAARLVESGYALRRLTMVDLFPQTFHIETVCVMGLG